jgi:hypothetical protein
MSVDKVFLSQQLLQIVEADRFTEEETLNLIAFVQAEELYLLSGLGSLCYQQHAQAVGKIDDSLDDGGIIFVRGDTADK